MFVLCVVFFFKHKTAYEMRISDWSSDVCSSDLRCFRGEMVRKRRACQIDIVGAEYEPVDSELHGRILHRATPRRGRRPCHEVPACVIVPAVRTVCGAGPVGACRAAGPSLQRLVEARARVLRSEEHTSELQSLM